MGSDDAIAIYDQQAARLAQRYEGSILGATYEALRAAIRQGARGGRAVDIGAGTGRDAAWLAGLGYEVLAVEPSAGMRAEAAARHAGAPIRWLDDRLPELAALHGLGLRFDLVLLSAVWQHVSLPDRPRAFASLAALVEPHGRFAMTLRHGSAPADRPMFTVSLAEVQELARASRLDVAQVISGEDEPLSPGDVRWTAVVLHPARS